MRLNSTAYDKFDVLSQLGDNIFHYIICIQKNRLNLDLKKKLLSSDWLNGWEMQSFSQNCLQSSLIN